MKEDLYILTIDNARESDAGEYAVEAKNSKGGFTLKVNVVVGKTAPAPKEAEKVESIQSMSITKTVSSTTEGGTVHETTSESSFTVMSDSTASAITSSEGQSTELTLSLADEKPAEKAKKAAEVEVVEAKTQEASATISETSEAVTTKEVVEEKAAPGAPKFDIPPEPVAVDIGGTIKLSCKVTGQKSMLATCSLLALHLMLT